MEDLNPQVLEQFGIKCKNIVKDKSCYICRTDEGNKLVKRVFDSKESLIFQNEIKVYLYENGYTNVDMFSSSTSGMPYVSIERDTYVMTDLLEGVELDFKDEKLFLNTVKEMARLHKVGTEINFKNKIYYESDNLIDKSKKNLVELEIIKKKLKKQKKLLDFDVIFLKNYDYYKGQLEETIKILESSNYIEEKKIAENKNQFCHNLLKEENILLAREEVYIGGFSKAVVGTRLKDVAMLIQRHKKYAEEVAIPIEKIVEVYSLENELSERDLKILKGILKYPQKYMKIINQYYIKKRSWAPSAINNRIERLVNRKNEYEEYLSKFGLEFFTE